MNTVKRIDPRRPFVIAASGLRRITLGEARTADASDALSIGAPRAAHRPQPSC